MPSCFLTSFSSTSKSDTKCAVCYELTCGREEMLDACAGAFLGVLPWACPCLACLYLLCLFCP